MIITLIHEQWMGMVPIVKVGARAEMVLGLPIDLDNGGQQIEIKADEVIITLVDEGE